MPMMTVTEKAIKEVKRIAAESDMKLDEIALRLRVVGGGCSGFMHKLDLDEHFDEEKDDLENIDGVTVAIDKRSAMYCAGVIIDYVDDLNTHGFKVSNPSSKSTCGCGSSFSMD